MRQIYSLNLNALFLGKKQDYLNKILVDTFGKGNHSRPKPDDILQSSFSNGISEIYKSLDGQFDTPPTRFGAWDINLKNFIIELDEERHFNRYRLKTLSDNIYKQNDLFDIKSYKRYCTEFENSCLKAASWGNNWKTTSSDKQFGISNKPKSFEGSGSSRWKQRAYYDFLKDISSRIMKVPVFRIAIYDQFEENRIDTLIEQKRKNKLISFIILKTNQQLS